MVVRWLRAQPFCRSATVFGNSVHAIVMMATTDAELHRACIAVGISDARVRTIEPSLEDVFVALTHRARAERARAEGST
jgi:hypothetical protein